MGAGAMTGLRIVGDTRDCLGEGPVWCPREAALYWVDIRAPAVRRLKDGALTRWPMPEPVGSLALREGGGILVALKSALSFFDPETGAITKAAEAPGHHAGLRFNDGKCDRQGRFWVGTMRAGDTPADGFLYRLDDRGCTKMLDGIAIPNSLCWSPDGRTMYFSDSPKRLIWAFPYDPATGALGERRVFARLPAPMVADGGTVDAEGYLWSANYGGWRVTRFAPDGSVDRVIPLPAGQITSCAFGGPDLRTLYIVSAWQNLSDAARARQPAAGALFALDVGVRGLPEPRYAW
jgi:sugar lactone lactonase YvrE